MAKEIKLDENKSYNKLWKITLIFILIQPIFDLLSFLYVRNMIPIGISTYGKPLAIGLINLALLFVYRKYIWKCAISYGSYLLLIIVHALLMNAMLVETSVILHEVRFMINFLYMIICFFSIKILYEQSPDKDLFVKKLKKTLLATFALYIVLYLLAVVSGTSSRTYEYSDPLKQGFKGWLDSGQIFGHALCICLPIIVAYLLNNKAVKTYVRIILKLLIAFPVLVLCLIGTKVTYFIPILVLGAQTVLEIFFAIKDKKKEHILNSVICIAFAAVCIAVYPITPVKKNIDINNSVISVQLGEEEIADRIKEEKDKLGSSKDPSDEYDGDSSDEVKLTEAEKNMIWNGKVLSMLEQKYIRGEIHPSDMRNKQLFFNLEKFKISDFKYKIFGIGYLNQKDMAIERDVLCVIFSFGILGFALILARPIWLWLKSAYVLIRKLLKADVHTLCLFEGFSIFFFISWFAGYTFIYTNFSVFLVVIMAMLNHGVKKLENDKKSKSI